MRRRVGRRAAMSALVGACAGPGPRRAARVLREGEDATGNVLRWLGTLELDDAAVGGGLSGLHVADDLTLHAVADLGRWVRGRLVLAADGAPLALEDVSGGPLCDLAGAALPRRMLGDAESIAALPGGGWLVGFERVHRIWHYPTLDGPAEPTETPPGLQWAPYNSSVEAMTVLSDGRWLVITEGLVPPGGTMHDRAGWIGGPGRWEPLSYRTVGWHDPSDACALPNGDALVLERRFTWSEGFTSVVSHLPAPIRAGRTEGIVVARLAPPLPTDNWEGISAFRHGGRQLVAVLSDDNEMPLQRTLLSVFVWPDFGALATG